MRYYFSFFSLLITLVLMSCVTSNPTPTQSTKFSYIPDYAASGARFEIRSDFSGSLKWSAIPQIGQFTKAQFSTDVVYTAPKINEATMVTLKALDTTPILEKSIMLLPVEKKVFDVNTDSINTSFFENFPVFNPVTLSFKEGYLIFGLTYNSQNSQPEIVIFLMDEKNLLDSSFGVSGTLRIPLQQRDDKFEVFVSDEFSIFAGYISPKSSTKLVVCKFDSLGKPVNDFASSGKLDLTSFVGANEFAFPIKLGAGGNLLVTKNNFQEIALIDRSSGKLDTSKVQSGIVRVPSGYQITYVDQGKDGGIDIVAQSKDQFNFFIPSILQYDSSGLIDKTWGVNGILELLRDNFTTTTNFYISRKLEGGFFLYGSSNDIREPGTAKKSRGVFVASITATGSLDKNFYRNGILVIHNSLQERFMDSIPTQFQRVGGEIYLLSEDTAYILGTTKKSVRVIDLTYDGSRTIGSIRLDSGVSSIPNSDGSFTLFASLCVFQDQIPGSCNLRNAIIKGKLF
jgi:hypothetical protein